MTFSQKVKEEIYAAKPMNAKSKKSFAYGLFLYSRKFSPDRILMVSENVAVSKLYGQIVRTILGEKILPYRQAAPRGQTIYRLLLEDLEQCQKILDYFSHTEEINVQLLEPPCIHAFLSGVFMACASVSDPIKGYHLEFSPPSGELEDLLFEILSEMGYPPKSTDRKTHSGIYYKESEPIEDILAIVGATTSTLELMEVKIYKDLRNKTNRQSNCDNANIDKTVDAAQQQIADIGYIFENGLENLLTEPVREIADLRVENPDLSLRELADLLGISRSGANHRLAKLAALANADKKRKAER